jgi:hypothetical protein
MSAALQTEETARQRLLDSVVDQLEPLYAMIYDGDTELARQAACDAMEPYLHDDCADLAVAGQIIACGLTAMRVLNLCMRPDIKSDELARLVRTVDTLGRTEQRHRKTGLYPVPPKPASTKTAPAQGAPQADLRAIPAPEQPAVAPSTVTPSTVVDNAVADDAATQAVAARNAITVASPPLPRKTAALTPAPPTQDIATLTQSCPKR